MKYIRKNRWEWNITDPDILEPWFNHFKRYLQTGLIKSNSERDVFRVESKGKKYIVKYAHPTKQLHKIKSLFVPKLLSEFTSSKLLQKTGISVVPVLGWGKHGSKSMLITEELTPSVNLREYWFGILPGEKAKRSEFLTEFSEFLRIFLKSGIYHPDFHPGNILIKTDEGKLALVDTYGVTDLTPNDGDKIFEMLCIIGAFRGELTDLSGIKLIRNMKLPLDGSPALLWDRVLYNEAAKSRRLIEKRSGRLLTDVRNSQVFEIDGKTIRIRKNFGGNLYVELKDLDSLDSDNAYEKRNISADDALALWKDSYAKQVHRLPHPTPVVWIKEPGTQDIVYIRKDCGTVLSPEEIRRRYKIAGIEYDEQKNHNCS